MLFNKLFPAICLAPLAFSMVFAAPADSSDPKRLIAKVAEFSAVVTDFNNAAPKWDGTLSSLDVLTGKMANIGATMKEMNVRDVPNSEAHSPDSTRIADALTSVFTNQFTATGAATGGLAAKSTEARFSAQIHTAFSAMCDAIETRFFDFLYKEYNTYEPAYHTFLDTRFKYNG